MIHKILNINEKFLPSSQLTEIYELLEDNLYLADWVTEPLNTLNVKYFIKIEIDITENHKRKNL